MINHYDLNFILSKVIESHDDISDINFTVGKPPQVETSGQLVPVEFNDPPIGELTPFQTQSIALNIIDSNRHLTENLVKNGYCDCSYYLPGKARFRVNIFSQRGSYSIVLRKLQTHIPTLSSLNLPEPLAETAKERNGLVLVTGATGSGKSSTLASILDIINANYSYHIITLEDPLEFIHSHKKSTFNQREFGIDFDTFSNGLRAALRQAPKVILVGEMRDRETVEAALSASETGHLVFSTLHTIDAGQSINRIIGMFEKEEEHLVRIRLADTIRWIISQRLVPEVGGGRIPVVEILRASLRIKESILHGESEGKTFYEIIDSGGTFGMQTFDKSVISLYKKGLITENIAVSYATRRTAVSRAIDIEKTSKGEKTTDIEDLTLDKKYKKKIK